MKEVDPHDRIELTGDWVGFGFQGGKMFTPEGHELEPCDMAWWSLTCNIAREWRRMMEVARVRDPVNVQSTYRAICAGRPVGVIDLATVINDRARRSAGMLAGPSAEPPMAAETTTGLKPHARV